MSPTTEERLTAAMRDAARDLRPPPGLAAAAIKQSRRTRRRVAAVIGALAITIGVVAATALPGTSRPAIADGPLKEAPDWSGCAARLPAVNENLDTNGLEASKDAVEVAACGPVVARDGEVTMDVHVAGPDDARRIASRVLDSQKGSLIEGCLYEVECTPTYFALRMTDGSVVRLQVLDLGRGAVVADGSTSWVGASRVLDAVQEVQATAPWYTYHSGDTPPPPLAFGDFECPDDVPARDWQTYLASPEPGDGEVLTGPTDRVVVCAYRPAEAVDGLVHVLVGIGYDDQEAAELLAVIEGAPVREEPEDAECPADTGLAYVVMVGAGETFSHVLYAETYGCRVAGEVTPNTSDDERMSPRLVTDEVAAALLAAVGQENLR